MLPLLTLLVAGALAAEGHEEACYDKTDDAVCNSAHAVRGVCSGMEDCISKARIDCDAKDICLGFTYNPKWSSTSYQTCRAGTSKTAAGWTTLFKCEEACYDKTDDAVCNSAHAVRGVCSGMEDCIRKARIDCDAKDICLGFTYNPKWSSTSYQTCRAGTSKTAAGWTTLFKCAAPVDCTWNAEVRGECSTTCGDGSVTFTRTKNDPEHGGAACDGDASRTESCNLGACPTKACYDKTDDAVCNSAHAVRDVCSGMEDCISKARIDCDAKDICLGYTYNPKWSSTSYQTCRAGTSKTASGWTTLFKCEEACYDKTDDAVCNSAHAVRDVCSGMEDCISKARIDCDARDICLGFTYNPKWSSTSYQTCRAGTSKTASGWTTLFKCVEPTAIPTTAAPKPTEPAHEPTEAPVVPDTVSPSASPVDPPTAMPTAMCSVLKTKSACQEEQCSWDRKLRNLKRKHKHLTKKWLKKRDKQSGLELVTWLAANPRPVKPSGDNCKGLNCGDLTDNSCKKHAHCHYMTDGSCQAATEAFNCEDLHKKECKKQDSCQVNGGMCEGV